VSGNRTIARKSLGTLVKTLRSMRAMLALKPTARISTGSELPTGFTRISAGIKKLSTPTSLLIADPIGTPFCETENSIRSRSLGS
jgi:hypothetical protein